MEKIQPKAKEHDEAIQVTAEVEAVCIDDEAQQSDPLEWDADIGERERFRLSQVVIPALKKRGKKHGREPTE